MSRLPILSGKQIIKTLDRLGYIPVRQRGSHVRLAHPQKPEWPTTVPLYKSIDRSLLKLILSEANIDRRDFLRTLRNEPK